MAIEFDLADDRYVWVNSRCEVSIQNDGGWVNIEGIVTSYDLQQILSKMKELQGGNNV